MGRRRNGEADFASDMEACTLLLVYTDGGARWPLLFVEVRRERSPLSAPAVGLFGVGFASGIGPTLDRILNIIDLRDVCFGDELDCVNLPFSGQSDRIIRAQKE